MRTYVTTRGRRFTIEIGRYDDPEGDDRYWYELIDDNGEVIGHGDDYASPEGCQAGAEEDAEER